MRPTQHHIIKDACDSLGQHLQNVFRTHGYRRVHSVVCAPKKDAIEGKLPAVGIYLYNVTVDEESISLNQTGRIVETVIGEDGKSREIGRRMPLWMRLDFLVTTWAQTPEEEHLLIGAAIKGLIEKPVLERHELKGDSWEDGFYLPVIVAQSAWKLDEAMLSRFWQTLDQPLKPAIQCWTTVPIYPGGEEEIHRVIDKDVRFFDLNKVARPK